MTLKTVLSDLSNAVQNKSGISGPLTLQEMTEAVNNISTGTTQTSSSGLKLYCCTEYSPASKILYVQEGLMQLPDGSKISLIGEYIYAGNRQWICAATSPENEYLSREVSFVVRTMISMGTVYVSTCVHFFLDNNSIAYSQASSNDADIAYIEDLVFRGNFDCVLDQPIVLSGDTASVINVFSGNEIISNYANNWVVSDVVTRGLLPIGYTPVVGKIYSSETKIAVNTLYPEELDYPIKFYECASVTEPQRELIYENLITLYNGSAGTANPGACGIYYPQDLSLDPHLWEYIRKDNAYKLSIALLEDDTTQGRIILTNLASGSIISSTPPTSIEENIWDNWQSSWALNLYSGSAATEEDSWNLPDFMAKKSTWDSCNMLTISEAGSEKVNGNYVKAEICMDYESAGTYGGWINDNGSVKLLCSEDWIEDEDGNFVMGLLFYSQGTLYEMHAPEHSSDDLLENIINLDCTWKVVNGSAPVPVISETEPEYASSSSGSWSGYKVTQDPISGTWTKSDTLTGDMPIKHLTPEVGGIFSEDTSVQIKQLKMASC